jgi:hypothetical protein
MKCFRCLSDSQIPVSEYIPAADLDFLILHYEDPDIQEKDSDHHHGAGELFCFN